MRVLALPLSLANVLLFFALIFILGWIDFGDKSNYEILRNIFIGNYLFFTVPVFVVSMFLLANFKGFRSAIIRMVVALTISIASYTLVVRYLVEKLNG